MTSNPPSPGPPFRPAVQPQQGQPFFPGASQQFRPVGQGIPSSNIGMPAGQNQFSQPLHQFPQWPGQPGHAATQTMPVPYAQPARPLMSGSSQSQPTVPIHGLGATGIPQSSPYPFGPPSFGQTQPNSTAVSQFMPMSQMHAPAASVAGQPWLPVASQTTTIVTPVQSNGQQLSSTNSLDLAADVANSTQHSSSDWQEHVASDGRRYYYNKKTGKSSWEKPVELMTPIERADASTVWKEFTTPEGKKYYYNKVTKESKWTLPEELKLAREQAQQTAHQGVMSVVNVASQGPAAAISVGTNASTSLYLPSSSPASTTPVVTGVANPPQAVVSGPSAIPVVHSTVTSAAGVQPPVVTGTSLPTIVSGSTGVPSAPGSANTTPSPGFDNLASQGAATNGPSTQNAEEVRQGTAASGNTNPPMSEGKSPDDDDEPLVFATKQEAKNAFKALLESVNVQSDWTWEQTMREISNDKRYSALKTLGERKQTFNEYLGQKKKHEAEERRLRQKKAREEFTKMLEESKELTSSMKWSKAASLFESDERFKAVDRARDREDLFDTYIVELERKEKERAAEDHRQNVEEFKKFLKSCDFIKVNSQWRKIQDRLEDDERCLRLEKIDRLIIFQDYIRDLEKEEEDAKKMQKEQLRRAERKNRDAFRKLMEEHVSSGFLTAKTRWLDYCQKVKDSPEYHAVAANTSGSRPKDLFEDVMEDLEKQYHDDKSRMKDSIKVGKISMVSTWTMEDFKAAVSAVGSPPISDINVKLLYEEMMERAKEKEEKEAKKRQRLADDFTKLLHTFKEITPSSDWEECKPLFEESEEYRSIGEESVRRDIFQDYITHLLEKAKEKERKREEEKAKKDKEREEKEKRKEKERKEKDREREKGKERSKKDDTDSENVDGTDSHGHREEKRREKDKDKKHRKRHRNTNDDASSDKDEKEESRKSRSHGSDRKKSRKHAHSPESDGESRHKKHRRDHRDGSRRNSGHDDLEDGELGEDGEIR